MTNLIMAVVLALCQVESDGNPAALGDYKNGEPRAVGILQQWEVSVEEACRIVGEKRWVHTDRLDPEKSKAMAFVTLRFHYLRGTTNMVELGGKWRNPFGRPAPAWYTNKVRRELERR